MTDENTPEPPVNPLSPSYEVGYKKPPKHSQWPPGHCGNPRGRGRGAKGLKTLLEKEINSRVTVSENGVQKSISKLEATIKRLAQKAVNGEDRAMNKLLELASVLEREDEDVRAVDAASPQNHQAILDDYKRRILANHEAAAKKTKDGK